MVLPPRSAVLPRTSHSHTSQHETETSKALNIDGLVEAVSAGIGASTIVGETTRRYWRRREIRQQQQFENAVSRIVDQKLTSFKQQIIAEIRSNRRAR